MTTLTKEYFDKALGRVATKDDLQNLATKKDLTVLESSLKAHTEKEVEDLAGMVSRRFDTLEKQLDVKREVESLTKRMARIEHALSIES